MPLSPLNKLRPAFDELAFSTQVFHILDNLKDFFQYIDSEWFHGIAPLRPFVLGRAGRTNSELEDFHSDLAKRNVRKRPNFWCFLNKLKSVTKAYHFEINEPSQGILTRCYKRK